MQANLEQENQLVENSTFTANSGNMKSVLCYLKNWRKEYKENRIKKEENHQIWRDFKPIYRPLLGSSCVRLATRTSTDPQVIFLYHPLNRL